MGSKGWNYHQIWFTGGEGGGHDIWTMDALPVDLDGSRSPLDLGGTQRRDLIFFRIALVNEIVTNIVGGRNHAPPK